ncbi:MAG: enoyl-CoA hydratase/isomerase family protein [Methylocella sp.]
MPNPEIRIETAGHCGVITLDRPEALNALTLTMVRAIACALDSWENDPAVRCVLIRGAGSRAFCAGADIRILYQLGRTGQGAEQLAFLREEYLLNRRIKFYPKPYVALADGIVMGGGAGLSVHGAHCVAGDTFTFAMPEVRIGFFPDVGATFFLPRLPGKAGVYLALTGERIDCGDAIALGLASAYVPSSRHATLTQRLIDGEDPAAAIAAESAPPPPSSLTGQRHFIDGCFAGGTVPAILEAIDGAVCGGSEFARAAYATIRSKSPTSLAIALRQMQIDGKLDLDEALRAEFRIAARLVKSADFYEGVRATLIDKDFRPQWSPAEINAVKPADIDAYFAPLLYRSEGEELEFPGLAVNR